jgi:hypothetical protein
VSGLSQNCSSIGVWAASSSLPPVVFTATAGSATGQSVDSATLNAGGVSGFNATSTDTVSVAATPSNLSVTVTNQATTFQQGQTGVTFFITVSNAGPGLTNGNVTVQNTAGTGLTLTSLSGEGWTCSLTAGTCTRPDTLASGGTFSTIQAVGTLSGNAAATVTNTASVTGGGTQPVNPAVTDTIAVVQTQLTLQISHTGNFTPSQAGASYSLLVRNAGNSSTSAGITLTATDNIPAGLTATAISGSGWTCTLATVSCTRSDSLPPGYSYPVISVVVNVTRRTPAVVENTATLSGLGATNFTAFDYTIIGISATVVQSAPSPAAAIQSQTVTFSAKVTSTSGAAPTGSVLFLDNGNAIASAVIVNQVATVGTNILTVGKHLIQAVYSGDSTYGGTPSQGQIVTVAAPASSGLFVSDGTVAGSEEETALVVFDMNGDGIPDLVVPSTFEPTGVIVYYGNGDGTFTTGPVIANIAGAVLGLTVGDLNGDGLPDLILATTGGVVTLLQTPSHQFGNQNTTSINTSNCQFNSNQVTTVIAGDFNLDGRVDIATINECGNLVELFGNGDGTFGTQLATVTSANGAQGSIALADLNGDGIPDFILSDGNNRQIHVLLGLGGGSVSLTPDAPAGTFGASPSKVAVGDFNGDGRQDIAVSDSGTGGPFGSGGGVCIFLGNGNGTFQTPASGCALAAQSSAVVVGDFNGDGKLDVAFSALGSGGAGSGMFVALGNGNGKLQTPQNYTADNGPIAIVSGDLNGDGVTDLAVVNRSTDISLFLGAATRWSVAIAPVGPVTQGETGAQYNVTTTNIGTAASSGAVTASVAFPAGGITATNIAGTGWSCTLATLTCTRSDSLAAGSPSQSIAGSAYPVIAVTVNVSTSAPSLATATATVSGGGATQSASASNSSLTVANTVQLTLIGTLPGATITATVNGTSYTLPAQVAVPANTPVTIAVTSPEAGPGLSTRYVFGEWSDNGAISHNVTPTVNTTLSVTFLTQYQVVTSVYPAGAGTVTPSFWTYAGFLTNVTATPNAGYVFNGYSGNQGGSSPSLNLAVNGPTIEVANFAASAPALSATVIAKTNGTATNQRVWEIDVTNKGIGTAAGVSISGATITLQAGPGPVSVVTPMPVIIGDLPAGQSGGNLITLNFPATTPTTIVQLKLTLTANGGAYTNTVTLNTQLR